MDGRTVRGNQKEQIFGIGTSCTIPPPRSTAFQTVPVSTTSAVFFKKPAPVKPSSRQDPLFSSAPDPQRLVPLPSPRTQMLKAHFEQQNMQMMENLSQQNQKQIQDLSSQPQSGFQQFLASSIEQMFKKFSNPSDSKALQPSVKAQPSQVIQTPQQLNQPVPTPPEPMDMSIPQAAAAIKKGLRGKGLSLYRSFHNQSDSISSSSNTTTTSIRVPPPKTREGRLWFGDRIFILVNFTSGRI